MEFETLLIEQHEAVRKIIVNRPEVLNAQSLRLRDELERAFQDAVTDEATRVIILAGAGKHFSAGHDLNSAQEMEDRKKWIFPETVIGQYNRLWDFAYTNTLRWRDLPKPTIAQVQGYCIMGGLMFASMCDLIVASEDALFTDRGLRWGIPHVQYASLPWDIGVRKAKEYLWTMEWITAEEAYRLGLVNKVVSREKLDEETMALAQRIALNDPFALRMSKQSINAAQDAMGFKNALAHSFNIFNICDANAREQARLSGQDVAANRSPKWAKEVDRERGNS